ncbi:MAG: site-specific DNA-methyltransferase [Verrucomicrobia bacterium]|nr:site-specific DNA-methyltransferase [Verrucomicrobiota bacterium]
MNKEQKITTDIKVPNKDLETLKIHFPHCFDKDGNFQLEKFKNNLTEKEINFSTESYGLDWLGKSYARLLASDPATTLLKADEKHNALPENANSENLLIKGDNLEVLKHLANAYYEQVKMIYIDPPYNTGSDGFTYQDDRKFTVKELQQLIGVDAEKAKRILDFTQSKSNSHSAWLTFMYPRLYIAKQLLKNDGVIFVSIDESEVAQLQLLLDEVFGEENFVALAPRKTGAGSAATRSDSELRKLNDYVFIYQKNNLIFNKKNMGEKEFPLSDENGDYSLGQFQASGSDATRSARKNMYYPIYVLEDNTLTTIKPETFKEEILPNKVKGEDGRWLWTPEKFEKDKSLIHYDGTKLQRKIYFDPEKDNTIYQAEKAWLDQFTNASGTKRFNELFEPHKGIFSNPKPVELIKHLINLINVNEDESVIILDFFGGSGTTGDAVMQINSEEYKDLKFILVQIPEPIDPKKNKASFDFVKDELKAEPIIFEITKERLKRVAKNLNKANQSRLSAKEIEKKNLKETLDLEFKDEKIKQLNFEISTLKNQDLGFKIFETTPIWEDYNFEAEQFDSSQTLFDAGKLTEDDIKALLTTWKTYDGITLTQELERVDLSGYTAYYGNGRLYLMNKGFTTESLKALLEKIDTDKHIEPKSIIAFGYHLESKSLREISENVKTYNNKKKSDIDFITRY